MKKIEFILKNGKKIMLSILLLGIIGITSILGIDSYVRNQSKDYILDSIDASKLEDVDAILVLGCQVKESGSPSAMLRDRLNRSIELYDLDASNKIIMSGDHGRVEYDEVNTMKQFAIDEGIPSNDIFMDHAGFSTYESMYRAKEIFNVQKIIIVTQKYHLYRAIYDAKALGIEAYGVSSDYYQYSGQFYRDIREVLARVKDFGYTIFKPKPTFLGDSIPINGDGNLTNDK